MVGDARPIFQLPRYPGAFFERRRSTVEVSPYQFDHAQGVEGYGGEPHVAQLAAQGQALFELRDRRVEVTLLYRGGSQDQAQESAGMAVQVSPHQCLALFDEGWHALAKAPVQHGVSEVAERERGARFVPQLLVEGHGLFQDRYRSGVVLLEEQDPTEPAERLGPDGGISPGVPLQRYLQPPLSFFQTLHVPEPPQRGHEPEPQLLCAFSLARLQGPRERSPQIPDLAPQP